jgi:hypothetical protein
VCDTAGSAGVFVSSCAAGGNAEATGKVLEGDRFLFVGALDVSAATLDQVKAAIGRYSLSVLYLLYLRCLLYQGAPTSLPTSLDVCAATVEQVKAAVGRCSLYLLY